MLGAYGTDDNKGDDGLKYSEFKRKMIDTWFSLSIYLMMTKVLDIDNDGTIPPRVPDFIEGIAITEGKGSDKNKVPTELLSMIYYSNTQRRYSHCQ